MPCAGYTMDDYEETYRNFRIDVPEYYNFGFDVIDRLGTGG